MGVIRMMHEDGLTAYIGAFVDELARSGAADIVISPGSRSTPIALLAAEHPRLRVWVIVDERSAGFFALGMAKAKRQPVALLCSSGTAAANYLPAVAEAYLARVPLIVLTADRPHELRDVGAPQTIQQIGLYDGHVKWFMEMPIPEASATMIRHARMAASRAAAVANSRPQGPVHLNFPLREPLVPDWRSPALWSGGRADGAAYTVVREGHRMPEPTVVRELAQTLTAAQRPLFVCGPMDEPGFAEAVTELAAARHVPVLADPLSQLRSGSHDRERVIDAYDAFLRDPKAAERLAPDLILRFGAMPVSKPLLQYMSRHSQAKLIVIDEGAGWRDPMLLAAEMIAADPTALCRELTAQVHEAAAAAGKGFDGAWLSLWQRVNETTRNVFRKTGQEDALFEGRLFLELQDLLPAETVLFAGNSMPIRDLDTFYGKNDRGIRILCNRGANGIDGVVSSALGVSAAGRRTVMVIGDLSFYHDLNGLLASRLHALNLTVILVNNDGGGIFSFLPQSELPPPRFEQLFGTPIGLDYEPAVAMYGGTFMRCRSWAEFRDSFRRAMDADGLQVIELRTDRRSNVAMHREVWRKVSERLADVL
jgi:2-succinyl-5-enolpyruvyl-6-hydroxy-3-cyclohexene-1-carboxylate synthase